MEVFSYSRLSKYESCPAAFYRHYCLHAEGVPSEASVTGKAAHAVIEAAMKLGCKEEMFFRVMSEIALATSPLEIKPEQVFILTYRNPVLREFHPDNRVEEHFVVPLDDEDPFAPKVQGYIDLWRDGSHIELIDWKTNYKAYKPTDTHQLGLYAWYLSRRTGRAVRGKLVFLRLNEVLEHEFSYRDMEGAREWAYTLAQEIQDKLCMINEGADHQQLFPTRVGDACRECEYAVECIDGNLPPVPGEVRTYREAEALGAEILRLDAALGRMKDALKAYVSACGPVVVGGRQFALVPSVYWKWNAKSLEAAFRKMEQEGRNPFDFLSLGSTQIKKLGWGEDVLRKLGAVKRESISFRDVAAS
ncbi:PD-(D/E)XK nuclease superfamily protein [Desulfofundulus australicus DSM 11792]|uniref:PD-(D/E)XK nuclease superfamily protein n=1 Tax=Desulfofundulus australicus DSM 11792 TaxID=1121425 RepID=A0A1M4XR18_9FIRM|nr:PD-(D/E)XK nuclease family protein [Desulfofundulus australicus]SHE95682.1 PD-(D/E)XK nuclease superfamily protein [Desulfofundulus australicus DSM 11792]